MSQQRTSPQQQTHCSISPPRQQAEPPPARVRVPLHKGVGLVRLCISAGPQTGSDGDKPQQGAAASWLVAKYAAWPFTCLWPESPPSQPPPLPSQSPSPPPMPPSNTGPAHRQPPTQQADTASQHVAYGTDPAVLSASHAPAAAATQQALAGSVAAAGTVDRPSGKQAPKVLVEPTFVNSAWEGGLLQPASKRHRGALSVSPDDGRLGAQRASSRTPGETQQPLSGSKADRNSKPAASADPTPSSRPAGSLNSSQERRAPSRYSEAQRTHPDSSHGRGRSSTPRDAPHCREQGYPRSSSRDCRRERGHGRDNERYTSSTRYREDDRSYDRSYHRSYHRSHTHNHASDARHRSRSISSSSRTSSSSRGRQRHSPRHHESRPYRQTQPRTAHREVDSGRNNRPRASHHHHERDRDRYPRADRDRDRSHHRERFGGGTSKQGHATHSRGSRSQRPHSRGRSRGAGDPPGVSVGPGSPSQRSLTSSVSQDAAPAAVSSLPDGFRNGRIFWSSDRTFKECMDRRLFASKDERDIADIGEDTAVFLWNCFQRELHGVWVTTKQGNLEPHAFGGRYQCQARVREQRMFARPLPIETVLPILPRIPGRPGTSFEQHLDQDQVCKVYDAFVRHNQS
ncbi:hypothetical protein ABBQ38_013787 [Trebouxia sp. C0009 RCD-2024]